MGKGEEIKRLAEELEVVGKSHAAETPLRMQKEDKEMYEQILKGQEKVEEEEEETRPVREYIMYKQ